MATSVITFSGECTISSDSTTAELALTFDPPSNIAGKLCYVKCVSWGWDYTGTIAGLLSRDGFYFTASWSQPLCQWVTENGTKPGSPFASMNNGWNYSHGPILCSIPNGNQTVTFTVKRYDGGAVTNGTPVYFYAALEMVEANSRQNPLC